MDAGIVEPLVAILGSLKKDVVLMNIEKILNVSYVSYFTLKHIVICFFSFFLMIEWRNWFDLDVKKPSDRSIENNVFRIG